MYRVIRKDHTNVNTYNFIKCRDKLKMQIPFLTEELFAYNCSTSLFLCFVIVLHIEFVFDI